MRPFVDKRLEKASNGLTIEGVAVAGGRLYAGLRGPSLEDKQAAIVSVSLDGQFSDKALDPNRHLSAVGQGRGIRDLVPYGKGMLVLAGPTPNDAEGDAAIYSVFYWDTVSSLPVPLGDLSMFEEGGDQIKPEALVPLGETESGLRILILFDGAKEGAPRDLLVKKP